MAKKKQLSIEQRARIDILAAEGFSQRSIAKKLGISKFGVQYLLQRKTETGVNEDRKRMKIQGVDLNFWPVVYLQSYTHGHLPFGQILTTYPLPRVYD